MTSPHTRCRLFYIYIIIIIKKNKREVALSLSQNCKLTDIITVIILLDNEKISTLKAFFFFINEIRLISKSHSFTKMEVLEKKFRGRVVYDCKFCFECACAAKMTLKVKTKQEVGWRFFFFD